MSYIQLYSNLYRMEASHLSSWKGKEESSTGAQRMRGALIHPLAKAMARMMKGVEKPKMMM